MKKNLNIRLAIQKSGRLAEASIALLQKCGMQVVRTKNQLLVKDDIFGINFIFARDDDIPGFLETGICDLGIIGRNLLSEYCLQNPASADTLKVVMPLGFSKCRLSIAVPREKRSCYEGMDTLNNKLIATSYPNILNQFLKGQGIDAKVVTMHGSVELAPKIGIADLVCDLVSTGATLKENGLYELYKIMDSEALLVSGSADWNTDKNKFLQWMVLRIRGVLTASQSKYVMLHIDEDKLPLLNTILPGKETPTVMKLKGLSNKLVVHVVSQEEVFWGTMEKLKKIGATSILVLPIEKMIA